MMLEYLGFAAEAENLERAVEQVYAQGTALTPDQGGTATTSEFCEAVVREL
jgi:isocitrate/isopropylmalate dehydrogenase